MNRARTMWGLIEPIHVVTYFAPEARATADALGDAATTRLANLLAPLATAVLDSGTLPQPNPVGFVRASS